MTGSSVLQETGMRMGMLNTLKIGRIIGKFYWVCRTNICSWERVHLCNRESKGIYKVVGKIVKHYKGTITVRNAQSDIDDATYSEYKYLFINNKLILII